MTSSCEELRNILRKALTRSLNECRENPSLYEIPCERVKNSNRGDLWIKCFGDALRTWCKHCEPLATEHGLRVFFRSSERNRTEVDKQNIRDFDRKNGELLYDIVIAKTASVNTSRQKKKAWYIKETYWAIESEFDENEKEAMKDFTKLSITCAPNRLFIGKPRDEKSWQTFIGVGKACLESDAKNVYMAAVPHPGEWRYKTDNEQVEMLDVVEVRRLKEEEGKWDWSNG